MKNRFTKYGFMIIAAVLLVALAFAGAASAETHDHSGWTAWSTANSLPTTEGNYYLTTDVTLSDTWTIPSGTTELCLNGHIIKAGAAIRLIGVTLGNELTITDCNTAKQYSFTFNNDAAWTLDTEFVESAIPLDEFDLAVAQNAAPGSYHVKVKGGVLYGNANTHTDFGAAVYVRGSGESAVSSFTMTGGNIVGCSSSISGGGVCADSYGRFYLKGGNIVGCKSGGNGGGVYISQDTNDHETIFLMTAGNIKGCIASRDGGGVRISGENSFTCYMGGGSISGCQCGAGYNGGGVSVGGGTFEVEDSATVIGNAKKTDSVPNNVYLTANNQLKLTWKFTGRIGIRNPVSTGGQFGTASGNYDGAYRFYMDNNPGSVGHIDSSNNLMWEKGQTVEVASWSELKAVITVWDVADGHRIVKVRNDIDCTESSAEGSFGGIVVTGNVTIMPAGNTADKSVTIDAKQKGRLFEVSAGGHLTIEENSGATIMLKGGKMDTVVISSSIGGCVKISGGEFTLKSGTIEECEASGAGGAVCIDDTYAKFTMEGGTITGCTSGESGSAVSINKGTFTLTGGCIKDCCLNKDLVYVGDKFTMTGGEISSNNGEGVYVEGLGTMTMSNKALIGASTPVILGYNNDEDDEAFAFITCGDAFAGNQYGAFNITFPGIDSWTNDEHPWLGKTVVKNGAGKEKNFELSSDLATDYMLKAGTATLASDLVLAYREFTVDTSAVTNGTVTADPAAGEVGTTITLTPAPNAGYHFTGIWTVTKDDTAQTPIAVTDNTFTLPASNVKASTEFAANKTDVSFIYSSGENTPREFTYNLVADIPAEVQKDGYVFHWQNKADGLYVTDTKYTDLTGKWIYTGADNGTLTFDESYSPMKKYVSVPATGIATIEETTALTEKAAEGVDHVVLKSVSGLNPEVTVEFVGASTELTEVGQLSGYTKVADISIFEVNVADGSISEDTAKMQIKVIFADEEVAEKNKDNVRFVHYKSGKWETSPLESNILPDETNGNEIVYEVETDSFSPFGVSIQTKKSSSGSHQGGSRILAATDAPTVTPTQQPTTDATPAVPTVKPTQQQTQKSPAPFVGLVLGLGAAAVLLRLRR